MLFAVFEVLCFDGGGYGGFVGLLQSVGTLLRCL